MTATPVVEDGSLEALVARVADEFLERQKHGERPDPAEYAARHPHAAAVLREVLAALRVIGLSSAAGLAAAADASAEAPMTGILGDFRILREAGRGGMGVVYEAEQISLGRRVALKVLPFAAALEPKQLQRFKNEAQAAAQLQHQHIVPVYGVGCERGVHYYAMQFIDGQTLAAVIHELRQMTGGKAAGQVASASAAGSLAHELASGRWAPPRCRGADPQPTGPYVAASAPAAAPPVEMVTPPVAALSTERSTTSPAFFRTVANLGVQAAEALEHAHQLGVIHRDIKPANLLVDAQGGLWITDFGLAHCQSQPGLTMTGDLLGTLRYMSPEQALAQRVPIDARTDIYSLGVTLYELLALEPAYNGRNREEVLRQIAFEEPRPPRHLNRRVPGELETVVLKAMAKDPAERYATAQELADDLRRFLEDKPIRARRPTLWQRAVKWARRHKAVVRATAVVLVLAVTALAVSTVLIWQVKEDLKQSLERERQHTYYQRIALAEREWSANNLRRYDQLLEECPADLRSWEWHYLRRLRYQTLSPLCHDAAVLCVAVSPDDRRLASSSQDGWVKVWDAQTGRELWKFRAHQEHARSVAFSPDGRRLATASWDGTLKVWEAQALDQDPATPPCLTLKGHGGPARCVMFSPDGQRLASAGGPWKAATVRVWDATTGAELLALPAYASSLKCLDFSPDGRRLVAVGRDPNREVKIWDAHTGQELLTFRGHTHDVGRVAFSPDGRCIASATRDWDLPEPEVLVWDAQTGREVHRLRGHQGGVQCLAFSPDGRRLASGGTDQGIKLWDVVTGREALTLRGHLNRVCSLVFSADGKRLVSAAMDRTVRIWDATPLEEKPGDDALTLRGHHGGISGVAFSPDGKRLASVIGKGMGALELKVWDAWTGKELHTFGEAGNCVAFSPDGRRLATAGRQFAVLVWDTTAWKVIGRCRGHTEPVLSVAFSPNGQRLASAGFDKVIRIWDAQTCQPLHELHDHNWVIRCVAFSPDGRQVASGSADGSVRVWDVTTGKEMVNPALRHAGRVTSVAFSRNGRCLASAGLDRTVRVWDTTTWKQVHALRDPTGGVQSVALSSDGRRLAWGSTDATVKVWDEATGEIQTLRGHTNGVEGVAFSPDGERIASASLDGTVKLWQAPPEPERPAQAAGDQGK